MKRFTFLAAICAFAFTAAFAQNGQAHRFVLNGMVPVDSGVAKLKMIADTILYPITVRHLQAQIINGKFSIEGDLPYPMAFDIAVDDKYISDLIVLEEGAQSIVINEISSTAQPSITNKAMGDQLIYKELTREYRARSDQFFKVYDGYRKKYPQGIPKDILLQTDIERQALYNEGDGNLLKFISQHPNSYWAFWRLAYLMNFGYENVFTDMMASFSDEIRGSYSGQQLASLINKSSLLAKGKPFPKLNLLDINGKNNIEMNLSESKFTLIDFWYTNCGPCLAKFPSYVNAYKEFHSKGFNIACISTDQTSRRKDLPKVIKKHKLNYLHYWDKNGIGARELGIQAFPTNFLVDAEGYILQKNITAAQLEVFLKKNLSETPSK